MSELDCFLVHIEGQGVPIDQAAAYVINLLETSNKGGYWGMVPGVKQILLDKIYWLHTTEIAAANAESQRLGFSRTLDLAGLPDGFYPVVLALHHTSSDLLRNIRLFIEMDDGCAVLDVTGDRWEGIKTLALATAVRAEGETETDRRIASNEGGEV